MSVHVSPSVARRAAFTDPGAIAGAGLLLREWAPGARGLPEAGHVGAAPEVAMDDLVTRQLAQALEAARGTAGERL